MVIRIRVFLLCYLDSLYMSNELTLLIIAFPNSRCFYYPLDSHLQAKMLHYIVIVFFHHVYLQLTFLALISFIFPPPPPTTDTC